VNEARSERFCQKNRSLDSMQHIKRVAYHSRISITSKYSQQVLPPAENWGWYIQDNALEPLWMTVSEASKAFTELISCHCKSHTCSRVNVPI
jgi:hypothetical protein